MGIFDFRKWGVPVLQATKVYTAAEVHAEVMTKVVLLMEEMKQQLEAVSLPAEIQEELELLKAVGLTGSKNMQTLADADRRVNEVNAVRKLNKERLKLIQLLHKHYGSGCMLMRLEDFMPLLDKYNLSCGFLADYRGSVPSKNLKEIAKVKKFVEFRYSWLGDGAYEKGWLQSQIKSLYRVTRITEKFQKPENFDRFPFSQREGTPFSEFRTRTGKSNLFIAAPAHEMDTFVEVDEFIRSEDPIVFSIMNQGVVIWSVWGEEGNDEVVQKYRRINEWIASSEALKSLT